MSTLRAEPGWTGYFTREQAPDALPNGTRIIKTRAEENDAHPLGTEGIVLGSVEHPTTPGTIMYFIEWAPLPAHAVACMGWKIGAKP